MARCKTQLLLIFCFLINAILVIECRWLKLTLDKKHDHFKPGVPFSWSADHAPKRSRRTAPDVNIPQVDNICISPTLVDPASVKFPVNFTSLPRPWERNDTGGVFLWSHPQLDGVWKALMTLGVEGLPSNWTSGQVMDYFLKKGALIVPWGGCVRDMIRGKVPREIDCLVTTDSQSTYNICVEAFGERNCHVRPSGIVRLGRYVDDAGSSWQTPLEPYDLAQWNQTLWEPLTSWDFTTNSMSFLPNGLTSGTGVVLDMTGHGYTASCNAFARIPVPRNHWPLWAENAYKLLRYWKLRVKGYRAHDAETQHFIVTTYIMIATAQDIQWFYCVTVLEGVYSEETGKCDECEPYICCKQCIVYNNAFYKDFGLYWNNTMFPAIQQMINGTSLGQAVNNETSKKI